MRKSFRRRINLSTFYLEGLAKSEVQNRVYLDRLFDEAMKSLVDFFDRVTGGSKSGEHTN